MVPGTGKALNECPTNVKEALEWLAALADGGGASHCADVINQKILVNNSGSTTGHLNSVCQTLCQQARTFLQQINQNGGVSYTSTYQTGGWNYLCQQQGTKCCQLSGYGACTQCNTSTGQQCHGCCKNCPKQICARIFCLIVPVVYSALQCLYGMVQSNGGGNNNTDSLQQYLRALGFNNQGGHSLSAQQVLQVRQPSGQPQNGTLAGLLGALGAATREINTALQQSQHSLVDGQRAAGRSISYRSSSGALTTPTSAKDLMLWTIFLPYCSNYGYIHGRLHGTGLAQNGRTQSGVPGAGLPYSSPFDNLMYGLHVLFIGMDGAGQQLSSLPPSSPSPLQPPRTLFDGIAWISHGMAPYEYYTTGSSGGSSGYGGTTQCCKLLVAGIPIISSAVEMLLTRNGAGALGYSSPYGIGLEQSLGFGGGTGMGAGGLSSPLGAQIIHDVYSIVNGIKTAYAKDGFQGLSSNGISTASSTTISTFREMLLWLQGLPCAQAYSQVRELLSANSGRSGSPTRSNGTPMDPLVGIIFKLPYLFYSLEGMNTAGAESRGPHSNGTMTRYITEFFQRQGIQVMSNGTTRSTRAATSPATAFSYDTTTIQKTFCAIVAVVYYVVDHLKRRYNGAGSYHSIGSGSGLLEFLGWQDNTQGASVLSNGSTNLNVVLQNCFGNTNGTTRGHGANGDHLIQLFKQLRGKLSSATTSDFSTHSAPRTFRETLLCLVGAPLTQDYENVKGDWKSALSSGPSSNNIESNITDTIVGVLQLFNKLEGNLIQTVIQGVFGNGNGTGGVSLKYNYSVTSGTTTNGVVGTLCGTTVVMRSVFGFMQQRCNGTVGLGAGTPGESWQSCSVTCTSNSKQASSTTECTNDNHLCKFLCLLGWDHQTRGGAQPGATTTSLTGSTFHDLLLKCFGDLASQGHGVSSYPVTSNGNEPVLEKLYQCAVQWFQGKTEGADSSITPSSTTTRTPSTIKDMMLWLIGLPLHSVYTKLTGSGSNGTNGVIKTKLESLRSINNATTGTYSLGSQLSNASDVTNAILSSSQGMIITMLAIEGSVTSILGYLTGCFLSNNSKGTDSSYGSSADVCFSLLVDYTYKVHFQLRFLLTMCDTGKADGGWKECEYGNGTASLSSGSSSDGSSLECKCNGQSSPTTCPRPLYYFLNGGVNNFKNNLNGKQNSDAQKNSDGNLRMGFFNGTLTTTPGTTTNGMLKGSDIHALLKYYVDTATENNRIASNASTQPLSLLAQCIVAIGEREPSTLGDCFELVRQLGYGELRSYVDGKLKAELKNITLEVTDEKKNNGQSAVDKLITAIQDIIPDTTKHSDHSKDRSLQSLMCNNSSGGSSTNSCTPYMKSLSSGLYSFYLPQITESQPQQNNQFTFLQYLYDMLRKLLDKMKALKEAFDACQCCTKGRCQGLISCQYAHPILYKFGFVFGNPGSLKSGKKCTDIKTQIGNVLSIDNGSESALFKAFECVIQVTYKVLLEKAKEKVKDAESGWNGVTSKDITKDTITIYVENAMDQSKNKFDCTFLCKLFNGNTECNKHNSQSQASSSQTEQIVVTKSTVTSITPIIPQYCPPAIDPYHYKVFQKTIAQTGGSQPGQKSDGSTSYSFKDAIDFHVSGANCITPMPVALRSVIDWILRVTVGDTKTNNSNDNITKLSEAIKSVLKDSGVNVTTDTEVDGLVTALVAGLRKFVGYEDRSKEVKKGVSDTLGTDGVKKLLEDKIQKITDFIGEQGKDQFASELGKALLKGRYECKHSLFSEVMRTISAVVSVVTGYKKDAEPKTFKDVVGIFTKILSSTHEGCKDLKCKSINSSATASQGDDQKGGLEILKEFFQAVAKFNQWTYEIGDGYNNKSSSDIVLRTRQGAEKTVSGTAMNGTNGNNGNEKYKLYYKLVTALTTLGGCHALVDKLMKQNGADTSSAYRTKIQALINKLNEVLEALKYKENGSEKKDIPLEKVESANQALITRTKANVENRIKREIQDAVEKKYTEQNGNCTNTHTQHTSLQNYICIQSLLTAIEGVINSKCDEFKSHLDDLKQLCQWLYRMGQLYAHGLKGFVESLVKHLEHIIQVIKWIEGIEKMMTKLKDIDGKDGMLEVNDFKTNGELKDCCETHNNLYNSNKFTDRDNFFTALKCRIDHLLKSYVLGLLPDGSKDKEEDKAAVATRRQFLSDLRLLALDRYTLQVWQDECNPKDSRPSAIKDWITFKDGIVRHSDLNAIKEALKVLTGIAYSSNTASPSAPLSASRSRIHDFHAICVIQKFSFEAPIAELERSLKELKGIQVQLSGVKQKCNTQTDVNNVQNDQTVTSFCTAVTDFLKEPYGIFSFAKFVHTILGPNIFSAVIWALEELTSDKLNQLNGSGDKKKKFCGIIKTMCEGLNGEENKEHYKLDNICKKLEAFITTLRKEYIFSYPVVTSTQTSVVAATPPIPSAKIPTCNNRDHSMSSICKHCYYYLARIFIGAIPNLYRHCRLLYEMCNLDVNKKATWNNDRFVFERNGVYVYNNFYLSLGGYMSRNGWIVKGLNEEMDKKELYELDPNGGGSSIYGNLYDVVSLNDPLSTTTDLKPLDKLFQAVMQHFRTKRNDKREKTIAALKKNYEDANLHKKTGIPFQAPPPVLPSTVRQVLFWLHEMDTNKAFYDAMSQHIEALCTEASPTVTISHDTILHVLKLSITQCLEVLATIEDPGSQNAQYYYELYTEEHYYAYPTVNIPLFFYTFVEKLMGAFLELNFVCVQCEFRALEGGWKDCEIGKAHQGAYEVQGSVCCICHERKLAGPPMLRVEVEGSLVCPKPLSAFLFSDQKNQLRIPSDVSQRSAYMSKGTMPCGFQLKNKAITDAATPSPAHTSPPTSMTGSVLVEPLRKLVGGHVTGRHGSTTTNSLNTLSTVIYLRDLLRYTLCLAVRPPWSMSENMAFFYRVTESWKKQGSVAHHNPTLLNAIHAEIDMFPGTFDAELLTTAVERFAGLEDKERHNGTNATHSNTSHHFDLRTLMGCQENNTTGSVTPAQCSPFMFPLALDVYTHYDERNSRAYLSWILNFAFGIYGQLRGLEAMIKGRSCMRNASQNTPSSCPSLPMCPGVLTALYQSGSSFMDQGKLAKKENTSTVSATTTKKTCNEFHSVLTGLLNCDTDYCTPLHNLIVQCEAFLWSIRMPFSLVQLSLWSFAVFFISYVFVVPLDHFKIKSHLFNRFKYTMHPSLLIADQQRRVSEVAYFSL